MQFLSSGIGLLRHATGSDLSSSAAADDLRYEGLQYPVIVAIAPLGNVSHHVCLLCLPFTASAVLGRESKLISRKRKSRCCVYDLVISSLVSRCFWSSKLPSRFAEMCTANTMTCCGSSNTVGSLRSPTTSSLVTTLIVESRV